MPKRGFLERFTKPVEDIDRERLTEWSASQGVRRLDEIELRQPNLMAGEVRTVRIVPRAGADALEATVSDGHGNVIAVFLGRRRLAGITPGRRLRLQGVPFRDANRVVLYNPFYELQ